jgi:hypothetical protein
VTTTPGPRASQYAETSRRLVNEAGKIALHANDEIGKGTFDFAQYAKSVNKMFNMALTAGLRMAPSLIPIPCLSRGIEEYGLSDSIVVKPDNECDRVLSVAKPFVQAGAPSCVIPNEFVAFDPAILRRGDTKFRVKVVWADLRSGTYDGTIRLARTQPAAGTETDIEVTIDL